MLRPLAKLLAVFWGRMIASKEDSPSKSLD